MRGSADGDPKGKVPCGMTWVWMPVKAGPFSSRGTCSSMAFNHDWLVDPRGDPVGRNRLESPLPASHLSFPITLSRDVIIISTTGSGILRPREDKGLA